MIQRIVRVLSVVVLSWWALAPIACVAQPTDAHDPQPDAVGSEAPTSEAAEERSPEGWCPRQWECLANFHFYLTEAQCVAACPGPCDTESNCSLKGCVCP
jgi:hypothetical protein